MRRTFTRDESSKRFSWQILLRVFISTILIGSLIAIESRYHIFHFDTLSLIRLLAAVYAFSAIYWYLPRRYSDIRLLAFLQIAGDVLLVAWLVALTGGIDSGFSILFHITIISASINRSRRGGYFAASLASILYGGMLDLQYYNMLGYARSTNFTAGQVLYLLFVNILSFYLVALLSGSLSERLRKTRQELQEKSVDFEDLRVLQDHILRSVGSGIVTMDMSGKITSWNNAAERITGYALDDIRRNWQTVFGEGMKGLFGHTDILRERPVNFEGNIVKKDGNQASIGFTASLLRDEKEQVRGIILTFQDITRLIEMEERMRRQERLATVGSLAAGIAHEIRNPLASLSGSIQMLREEKELSADGKYLMEIVLRETDRLNTIITEFLDYARPKTHQSEVVQIEQLVAETVLLFRNSTAYRDDLSIKTDIREGIAVAGDPLRLRQVLWNLLINAAQAMTAGGVISVTANQSSSEPGWIELRIADTGEGISPDNIRNIFDPFFTTKSNGSGLGLAIVYRIIEDHGGSIEAKSEQGKGCLFSIRLPSSEKRTDSTTGGDDTPGR